MAARPIYFGSVKNHVAQILNADASNLVTLVTAGASGSQITALGAASTDTSDRDVAFYVTKGGTDYLLGTVKIPANSGNTNALAAVDVLSSAMLAWVRQDADGAKYLHLENGSVLKAKALTTVTAAKAIQFFAHGGDV